MDIATKLPYEVRAQIFSYLQVKDLVSLSRVSAAFDKIMDDDFWRLVLHKRLHGPLIQRRRQKCAKELILAYLDRNCACCEAKNGVLYHDFSNKRLCLECRKSPEYALISDRQAVKQYCLQETDLSDLRFVLENPRHPRYSAKLYSLKAVEAVHDENVAAKLAAAAAAAAAKKRMPPVPQLLAAPLKPKSTFVAVKTGSTLSAKSRPLATSSASSSLKAPKIIKPPNQRPTPYDRLLSASRQFAHLSNFSISPYERILRASRAAAVSSSDKEAV